MDLGENLDQQIKARSLCMDFSHTHSDEAEKRIGDLWQLWGEYLDGTALDSGKRENSIEAAERISIQI